MLDCKPTSTLVAKEEVDTLITSDTDGKALGSTDHATYRHIIGKLMYAMIGSRPDHAYVLSMLGCHTAAPDTYHLEMVKCTLAYVKRTLNYKLY